MQDSRLAELKKLITELHSPLWSKRFAAQSKLDTISVFEDWEFVYSLIGSENIVVLELILVKLKIHLESASAGEAASVLKMLLKPSSSIVCHKELLRLVLESALSLSVLSYRKKIDLLKDAITDHQRYPKEALVYFVRALGFLQAKRVVTTLGELLEYDHRALQLEVVKAFRLIRDAKASPYLELLFSKDDPVLVSAAIDSFSLLGHGFGLGFTYRRKKILRKLFESPHPQVRRSVVTATLKLKPEDSSKLLVKFFEQETDRDNRFHIIKKVSLSQTDLSADFLFSQLESSDFITRISAAASIYSMPSVSIKKSVKKYLASKNSTQVQAAIRKVVQLPQSQAESAIEKLKKNYKKVHPVVLSSLIEAVASLSNEKKHRKWIEAQIQGNLVSSVTAAVVLSKRMKVSTSLFVELERLKSTLPLQSALAIVADNAAALRSESMIEKLKHYAGHSSQEIRVLAFKALLRLKKRSFFELVWTGMFELDDSFRVQCVELVALSLSNSKISPAWIPVVKSKIESNVLEQLLSKTRIHGWSKGQWSEVLLVLGSTKGNRDQSSHFDLFWSFCLKQKNVFQGIINEILITSKDVEQLHFVGQLMSEHPNFIEKKTLRTCFSRLSMGHYLNPTPILTLLSAVQPDSIIEDYTAWMLNLPEGKVKQRARKAMGDWIMTSPSSAFTEVQG